MMVGEFDDFSKAPNKFQIEFGFFVDRAGQLELSATIIFWKGTPKSFSMIYPYVLAFDPNFIEVRCLETGDVKQILPTYHAMTLRTDADAIHYVEWCHTLDEWCLKELGVNKQHPSNVTFKKGQREAKANKRRGMIGSYSTT